MSLQKIFNWKNKQPEKQSFLSDGNQVVQGDINQSTDLFKDMLSQNVGRLIYPATMMSEAHSDAYTVALQVCVEFDQIEDYEERIAFWDAHPKVFGQAAIIVLDTKEEKYKPYYGFYFDEIASSLSQKGDHFKMVTILPEPINFWTFVSWCSTKYLAWRGVDIPNSSSYWENIKTKAIPEEYLVDLLSIVESDRNAIRTLPRPFGFKACSDEQAKNYFFYYGNQVAGEGRDEYPRAASETLYLILNQIITCPLWNYGKIVSEYYRGYNTTQMVAFLREQKKRFDNGEDIRVPPDAMSKYPPEREQEGKAAVEHDQSIDNHTPIPQQANKQQKFLDEIATIEKRIASNGDQGIQRMLSPNLFTPIAALWESIGDKDSMETRGLFRQEIKDQVDFSTQVLGRLVMDYEIAIKKQPDKQANILMEHRDWYVDRLAEIYVPIEKWYYSFWDENKQTVERIDDLELEVFHFCYGMDKPFMVGLKLMQSLYGYCRAIDRFNKMLHTSTMKQQMDHIEKPKRINTEARDKQNRLIGKYEEYKRKKFTESAAVDALAHDFRLDYNPKNKANRKKAIQAIIRKWNNKEK